MFIKQQNDLFTEVALDLVLLLNYAKLFISLGHSVRLRDKSFIVLFTIFLEGNTSHLITNAVIIAA